MHSVNLMLIVFLISKEESSEDGKLENRNQKAVSLKTAKETVASSCQFASICNKIAVYLLVLDKLKVFCNINNFQG